MVRSSSFNQTSAPRQKIQIDRQEQLPDEVHEKSKFFGRSKAAAGQSRSRAHDIDNVRLSPKLGQVSHIKPAPQNADTDRSMDIKSLSTSGYVPSYLQPTKASV